MWKHTISKPWRRLVGRRPARPILVIVGFSLLAAACGGGGASEDTATETSAAPETTVVATTAAPTTAAPTTTTEAPFSIGDAEASVVRIDSQGSFAEIGGEEFSSVGGGSGFIIDEEGHVVTNNHVVTGAGLIEVAVAGYDDVLNARVVAVSECADLAVLDLEGDGFTPLSWYDGEIDEGIRVYTAGFPLTNETSVQGRDYTVTQGIVSSAESTIQTGFAAVESVLEHDAQMFRGNSGGPLIAETGGVIGVNYAGLDSSGQNFAISADLARPIIERLLQGEDVDSIGVNGQAVLYDDGSSAVFVSNVAPGSVADLVGIEPGDWILELNGVVLATDGTMREYCDVLRSNGPDDQIAIRVLRPSTEEVLEGRLNGAPLTLEVSLAQQFEETVDSGQSSGPYTEYVVVTDDSGQIVVEIPAAWSEVDGRENVEFGPSIYAAPSISGFLETWTTPGVILEATSELGPNDVDAVLAAYDFSEQCVDSGRQTYDDGVYIGQIHLYEACGGEITAVLAVAVTPPDGSLLIRLLIQATEPRDLEAADRILGTFLAQF